MWFFSLLFLLGILSASLVNYSEYKLAKSHNLVQFNLAGSKFFLPIIGLFFVYQKNKKLFWQHLLTLFLSICLFTFLYYKFDNLFSLLQVSSLFSMPVKVSLTMIFRLFSRDIFFLVVLLFFLVYDWKYKIIPDEVILPVIGFGIIMQVFWARNLSAIFLGAIIFSSFFFIMFLVSCGRWIGGGDIRLGFLIGLAVGFPNVLEVFFLTYLIGAVVSLFLLGFKLKKFGSEIPFAPFLAIATFYTIFFGGRIIEWFLS